MRCKFEKKDLIKKLKGLGAELDRQGQGHEVWKSENGNIFTGPRHKKVNEKTAKNILDQAK